MATRNLKKEVVLQFLLLLPVKSLLRFRCVCKEWCSLIDSPSFIENHLNHSTTTNNECILVKRFMEQHRKNALSFASEETLDVVLSSTNIDVPYIDHGEITLIGPSNGIVCLECGVDLLLCNPATREFKSLPPCLDDYVPGLMVRPLGVGFGFDEKSNDYKVVKIDGLVYDIPTYYNDYYEHGVKVEIYSLGHDSWRKIDATCSFHAIFDYYSETLFKGSFHWLTTIFTHELGFLDIIVSFHMGTEVFEEVPTPVREMDVVSTWKLAVFNDEFLALIMYGTNEVEKYFEVWVMNEYGDKESWSMHFIIGPLLGICSPVSFGKYNELLLLGDNGELVFCDLDCTNKIRKSEAYGPQKHLEALLYIESLVSLKRFRTRYYCEEDVSDINESKISTESYLRDIKFPEYVVIEILSRLSVKPLLRFKSVCKRWHAIIKSRDFIARTGYRCAEGVYNINGSKMSTESHLHYISIPEDVVIEILSRLPVKPLLRFKSVCKRWYTIIKSPDFIAKHLQTHYENDDGLLLVQGLDNVSVLYVFELFTDKTLANVDRVVDPYMQNTAFAKIVLGPINGLYLLYNGKDRLALWNPATREFKPLPLHPCPGEYRELTNEERDINRPTFGLGFDPSTNDYKVISFISMGRPESSIFSLYNLSNDSWRELKFDSLHSVIPSSAPSSANTYWNGYYYFAAWPKNCMGVKIYALDMSSEVVSEIEGPPVPITGITMYNGHIASLIYHGVCLEECSCDIWVMESVGFWTKRWTVVGLSGMATGFYEFCWMDGTIFFKNREFRLVFYNIADQQLKDTGHGGVGCENLYRYKESLVSLKSRFGERKNDVSINQVPPIRDFFNIYPRRRSRIYG